MTRAEKLSLVHGGLAAPWGGEPKPEGSIGSAGFIPGVPRLGIPPLQETDAELGIANPGGIRRGDTATAMPSNLSMASTFDAELARRQGEAVGAEARAKGFNLLMGGAANLIRDPRGGRNFEYFSEDPLLTGIMAGAEIAGVQSQHVLSTLKHFALNDQETDRVVLDARIDAEAARESDLLAFELAIEQGGPAAVMCAYNKVNGAYACENSWLLNEVLKGDWRFPGFVLSDWGAVHSTASAVLAGLDQESGEQLDTQNFFETPLAAALREGAVSEDRLDDMATRIVGSMYRSGLMESRFAAPPSDPRQSDDVALAIEREGIVLLKNEGALPLSGRERRVAVIGARADRGVPAGGGSSEVTPRGGFAAKEPAGPNRAEAFDPSSPLEALRRRFAGARVDYDDGRDALRAARLAAQADVAIVFADQWMTETADAPDLALPGDQDALIETVSAANSRTIVVLETGGPVLMPWLGNVAAVLEAWYGGQRGAEAIVDILSGVANPSGRLPVTFPQSEAQLPHPRIQGDPGGAPIGPVGRGGHYGRSFVVNYDEGAQVGYKWFHARGEPPLFPFGFGLSYTAFSLNELQLTVEGAQVVAKATVSNIGAREGVADPQLYLIEEPSRSAPMRLLGWQRVDLKPGETREIEIHIDPRLLAKFDESARVWRILPGDHLLGLGLDSEHLSAKGNAMLAAVQLPP
jgi:beta-glucosidase